MMVLGKGCVLAGFLFLVLSLSAQTFTSLYSFPGGGMQGAYPAAALVQATDGSFYGTTSSGGVNDCNEGETFYGCGAVFQITTGGTLTTLYSFCPKRPCPDGSFPNAALIQATDGNFYGTTEEGGTHDHGTVFRITPAGTLTRLYSFAGVHGTYPVAPLVQATDGNLYGTTSSGGAKHKGTVFKITLEGELTTLYSFCSQSKCSDGANPSAVLTQATDGNFYGTTENGGASKDGTVFKITLAGTLTTLYSFDGKDGSGPAGLIQATDGNLYGTTVYGAKGGGTVFKVTPGGSLTTLYTFCSQPNCTDGAGSAGALIQGSDGNFYGTTVGGGATDNGTIFDVTAEGELTTLYSFDGSDGNFPNAALIQATNGSFYGTTVYGGGSGPCYPIHGAPAGCGTVFSLSVGLYRPQAAH